MSARRWTAGLLGALLVLSIPWPAQAIGDTSARCAISIPTRLSPGFSLKFSTGTYGTAGETGTISCIGSLDGYRVTGPGSFGFEGVYAGDCFGNDGSGTYSFTVPTELGPKHFTGSYSERRTGFNGPVEASHPGGRFEGLFLVLPEKGDCLVSPVTDVVINIVGTFAATHVGLIQQLPNQDEAAHCRYLIPYRTEPANPSRGGDAKPRGP